MLEVGAMSIVLTLLWMATLPPITSLPQALGQLGAEGEGPRIEALKNLDAACRGKYRRELIDKKEVGERLTGLFGAGPAAVKKAVLDAGRCFSPAKFLPFVKSALEDRDPAIVAYGGEVAARFADAAFATALLDALEKRASPCSTAGVSGAELEACVWVTYAPSAVLSGASADEKKRGGELGVKMFDAPYPKVREVAVETVAASEVRDRAKDVAKLIARETKKGEFAEPNSPELVARFKERQKALEKSRK